MFIIKILILYYPYIFMYYNTCHVIFVHIILFIHFINLYNILLNISYAIYIKCLCIHRDTYIVFVVNILFIFTAVI